MVILFSIHAGFRCFGFFEAVLESTEIFLALQPSMP
jgi:hypothetical protein